MQVSSVQGSSTGFASAVAQLSSAIRYDPKDTNQDGVVSAAEELAYALKHPELGTQSASSGTFLSQYSPNGTVNASGSNLSSAFDTYA